MQELGWEHGGMGVYKVDRAGREDAGLYQCWASREGDSSAAVHRLAKVPKQTFLFYKL